PQVESIAIPFQLAPSNTVVPAGTRTSPPSGRKVSRTRPVPASTISGFTPAPAWPRSRRRRGLTGAVGGDPATTPLVCSQQEVGRAHCLDALRGTGVHDRAGQAVALRDGQEGGAHDVAAWLTDGGVGAAPGHSLAQRDSVPERRLEVSVPSPWEYPC